MLEKPLAGRTVALLRARGQGGDLESGLVALGARVLEVPMIAFAPPEDASALERAAREAGTYDWIALTSPNAVSALLSAIRAGGTSPGSELARVSLASVGPGTTRALAEAGLEVALQAEDSVQEGLARALVERGVSGKRILLPKADIARDALARALREAGALVDEVTAYRTVEGEGDPEVLLRAIDEGTLDAVCFTSSSTVRHIARRIGRAQLGRRLSGGRPIVASMGPVASATLRELGVEPTVEAREHTASGLVAAVRDALAGRSPGASMQERPGELT